MIAPTQDGSLSITYLLEDTALFGGVKVVLAQANLLAARGHRVFVASKGRRPDWFDLEVEFLTSPTLSPAELPPTDVAVATYWTTIAAALAAPARERVHYCQGFEASYTHNSADHEHILAAYTHQLPAMVVSSHLGELLRSRFGRPAHTVLQPLDREFRPRLRWGPRTIPRVLIVGPREIDWKGVETGLAAVAELRRRGLPCRLVRISQWPAGPSEAVGEEAMEFHSHLTPRDVANIMRSCDLLLAPSWEQEGFGLPALEAMASGVPVVASAVASYRGFAAGAASLVAVDDPEAFATAAWELLTRPGNWRAARRRGLEIAARYSPAEAGASAESALRWVASGAWRQEIPAQTLAAGVATGRHTVSGD